MLHPNRQPRPVYPIDPVAFLIALPGTIAVFASPALVVLALDAIGFGHEPFGPLLIPAVIGGGAALFGGPVFLTVGGVSLVLLLRRGIDGPGDLAGHAIAINVMMALLIALAGLVFWSKDIVSLASFLGIPGLIFAPLWGWMFGKLYARLRRDFYVQPV